MNIQYELSAIKSGYRNIFMAEEKTIREALLALREKYSCSECDKQAPSDSFESLLQLCSILCQ